LNLRPGDLSRGWPFFSYYFLIVASYVMGGAARDALFLDKFKAVQLPYADIAIAVLVGFVVSLYLRASRRTGLKNLLILSLLFFSANAFAFWWAAHYSDWEWLFPVLYVWVGIFGVLATTQVWTLANFVWTTRESKRLFSLLGSGGILGGIFGGLLTSLAAPRFGTESLLVVMGVFSLLSGGLVEIIWRGRDAAVGAAVGADEADSAEQPPEHSLWQSLRSIRESGLLQTIAVLICIASIATTVAGWQLKAIAKEAIQNKDQYAAFFGSFGLWTGVASLGAQLLITSKILKRFGVGVALFVLPAALLAGSLGVLASGSLLAAILLRGSDKVLRYSVDTSALQLLYLPVPSRIKLQAKSFIDTVVWRLGDGLAGFTVLIFAATLHLTPRQMAWVNLVPLAAWMCAAFLARRQYIATLSGNMRQLRLDPAQNTAPILDVLTTNVLAEKLASDNVSDVLYALDLFEMGHWRQSHEAVRNLLEHSAPEVRQKAIAVLNAAGDKSARAMIAPLLHDEHIQVRTEALLYMTQHDRIDPLQHIREVGDFAGYSVRSAIVAFLSQPGESQNLVAARVMLDGMAREDGPEGRRTRLEAARLIGWLPDHFEVQLHLLLQDADQEVARHAIRAVAALRKRREAPLLVERLGDPELRNDAADALLTFEDSIAGTLRDYLADNETPIEIRREIPPILLRLGTPVALRILANNIIQGDSILRYRIIAALNKLRDLHKSVDIDVSLVETVLVAEIMGLYRSYQILASLKGQPAEPLLESMKDDLERIFRLIKLMAPEHDLQSAYIGLQSKDPVMRANALEYLDNTLKPQLKNLLVPLIDSDVSVSERSRIADRFLGVKVRSLEEAVAALRAVEDPWLKSCAELWSSAGTKPQVQAAP